jgi:hypothetical protein
VAWVAIGSGVEQSDAAISSSSSFTSSIAPGAAQVRQSARKVSARGLAAVEEIVGAQGEPPFRQVLLTNAIAPSFIDTVQLRVDADDTGITLEEMRQRYREQIPVRRLAAPGTSPAPWRSWPGREGAR